MLNISESINYRDYMRSLKVHPLALSDIKIIQKTIWNQNNFNVENNINYRIPRGF